MKRRGRRAAAGLTLFGAAALSFCAGPPEAEIDHEEPGVVLSAGDVVVVSAGAIEAGPLLSGSLQPERSATVLAEISGAVVRASAEPGQSVTAGAVLMQIEDAALREALLSARAAATSAESSAQLAARNAERAQKLHDAGAIPQRQLEDARLAVASAEAQQSDARARVALASSQLAKATVRAPFGGIVSERPVNTGDVVTPGTHLITIVDPASMRLVANVPATDLEHIAEGARVEFEVTGYVGRTFTGRVTRVTPTVDPVTRQVTVYARIPNTDGHLVGGLYAEGRLSSQAHEGLLVPVSAVDLATTPPTILRVRGGVVERVSVEVGIRDEGLERVEVVSGLAAGDSVLVGAGRALAPGTEIRMQGAARPAAPGR